jgi:hypothetical protein
MSRLELAIEAEFKIAQMRLQESRTPPPIALVFDKPAAIARFQTRKMRRVSLAK